MRNGSFSTSQCLDRVQFKLLDLLVDLGVLKVLVDAPVKYFRNRVLKNVFVVHGEILYREREDPPHQPNMWLV